MIRDIVIEVALSALLVVFIVLWATKKTTTAAPASSQCVPQILTWNGTSLTNDQSYSTFTVDANACGVTLVLPDDDLSSVAYFSVVEGVSISTMYVTPSTVPVEISTSWYNSKAYFNTHSVAFTAGTSFTVLFPNSTTSVPNNTISFGWNKNT